MLPPPNTSSIHSEAYTVGFHPLYELAVALLIRPGPSRLRMSRRFAAWPMTRGTSPAVIELLMSAPNTVLRRLNRDRMSTTARICTDCQYGCQTVKWDDATHTRSPVAKMRS